MTIPIIIAAVCLVVLFLIGRKGLKEGRKAAEENTRIYDKYYSDKP